MQHLRKHLALVLTFLFLGTNIFAHPPRVSANLKDFNFDSLRNSVEFDKDQIKRDGKLIGRFAIKKKDIKTKNKQCLESYQVEIFNEDGAMVADYEVTVCDSQKKNKKEIVDAQMKTSRDKVTHNGNNFINYANQDVKKDKIEVPQFENAVQYLISYDYL